jgi:hypothetical protein
MRGGEGCIDITGFETGIGFIDEISVFGGLGGGLIMQC